GTRGRHHHRGPAALAVADDGGLRRIGMELTHTMHEPLLRLAHIEQRLAGLGLREKDYEVDGMPVAQRYADLRVVLEPANAGTVARARVDDDVRAAIRMHLHAGRRDDAHQRVVDGTFQRPSIEHSLVVEMQYWRQPLACLLDEVVATLTQRV